MPVLGITGGIASGKSLCRDVLTKRIPAVSFDADACVSRLLEQDPDVRRQIETKIDPGAYPAGRVDRKLLRDLIYQSPEKKKALEAILHPVVRREWTTLARPYVDSPQFFIVDIPLLYETGVESFFNHVILVACSREVQLARLHDNRGVSREIGEKIIAAQLPLNVKMTRAHHVIWNDGHLDALMIQTDLLARYLHARYG